MPHLKVLHVHAPRISRPALQVSMYIDWWEAFENALNSRKESLKEFYFETSSDDSTGLSNGLDWGWISVYTLKTFTKLKKVSLPEKDVLYNSQGRQPHEFLPPQIEVLQLSNEPEFRQDISPGRLSNIKGRAITTRRLQIFATKLKHNQPKLKEIVWWYRGCEREDIDSEEEKQLRESAQQFFTTRKVSFRCVEAPHIEMTGMGPSYERRMWKVV